MQRTYKSKKDVGGGLDHRDMLLAVDEKSSAFDCFYIQNIKQTKRELSCVGATNHRGVHSNKVRKRKYVKRIIKDVEPVARESLSASVFLTPDKSIHVKKALDPFDQLLNSSPAPFESKKDDIFDQLISNRPSSTDIGRRKRLKKYKHRNSGSIDSDIENIMKDKPNETQNASDIQAHEFIIEKENKPSPILDNSINNIARKISQLNNYSLRCSNGSVKKSLWSNMNRLTNNLQSPLLRTSPLSSTPFTDKHRSKSIYKFSPIPMNNFEESPNYVTVSEENVADESVIFIPKRIPRIKQTDNFTSSPINRLPDTKKCISSSKSLFSTADTESNSNKHSYKNSEIQEATEIIERSHIEVSSLETSEFKPFLGFSANEVYEKDEVSVEIEENDKSIVFSVKSAIKETLHNFVQNFETDNNDENQNTTCKSVLSNVNNTIPSEPFLGFTEVETGDDLCPDSEVQNLSDTEESDINNENTSVGSQVERESLYDTCYDEQSSIEEDNLLKEPAVLIQRMDNSVFMKYYKKSASSEIEDPCQSNSENIDKNSDSENCYSLDNLSNESSENKESSVNEESSGKEEHENSDLSSAEKHSTSDDENVDCISIYEESEAEKCSSISEEENNSIEEEDRGISFVTTRRRNEFTNNSSLLVLDDTMASASSTDCDKTIISNKYNEKDISTQDIVNTTSNAEDIVKDITLISAPPTLTNDTPQHLGDIELEPRISTVTTRKSTRLFKQTSPRSPAYRNINENEITGIILQPGKKWERSLSIYRRMTMLAEHFDHSVLEDEDLHAKGRKYRQSVITTMEMQDSGSILNESIHSRRSTFVSKPSRSTIRIIKEPNTSRVSLCNATVLDLENLKGFLEDCDDTVVGLSRLSIADREHDITVLDNFHEPRVAPARDYVLRRCNQTDTILFDECYPDPVLKNCRKIGEGVYGEVYLWRATDGRARVMKIVPIAGTTVVNGEHQKDFHEIISEIVIAMELSALRAPIAEIECHFDEGKDCDELDLHSVENATDIFNEVLAVRCVYGSYPSRLLDLWELYDETTGSENDSPAILPPDQQYIVLELANAGQDLESYQFNSAEQAHALFLQVAFGLAVGEEAFQFEHRDLHWGNVLIAPTDQKWATFVLRGRSRRVARCGVRATIIDYSLSRLSLPLAGAAGAGAAPAGGAGDAAALYNDLAADPSLFGALGDYQFEVYRLMRDKLGNDWKNFEPYTNILWLHYTVDKMITALRYKRTNTKTHRQFLAKLKAIKERLLGYGSAVQFVLTDNEY